MDAKNSYKDYKPYLAYCKHTDEKEKLHQFIRDNVRGMPVILDLGCGNGINSYFMANLFPNSCVHGVERSQEQIQFAEQNNLRPNITYFNMPFEEFQPGVKYNLILASHVLQYIDSGLESFVEKATSHLAKNGELWFVQQTRQGMAQIIEHQRQYLTNPRFMNWKTFEDYKAVVEAIFGKDKKYAINVDYLDTSFKGIDFANPSEEDKLRLQFIFCLDSPFDDQSEEFKANLAGLTLGQNGRISHPNGIMRIRRIS